MNRKHMNTRILFAGKIALVLLTAAAVQAADAKRFDARSGSKMRIEGTSNIHDWQVESPLIAGFLEAGPGFPTEPGQAAAPGKIEAKAETYITVRSLKSVEKDGKPYSDKMDEIMYEKLKLTEHPKIIYRLTELTLKEAGKDKDAPHLFEAKGELAVAGVTNAISMPIKVMPLGDNRMKVSGAVALKMTSFKIEPPAPKIALGLIKTGDEVKLSFDWMVAQRKTPAAAASK
jgi:hypothetical protein